MKKIKGRKFSKRLAGAITLALLAAQAGSALAADTYNKQIIESNYAGSVLRTYWQNEGISDGYGMYLLLALAVTTIPILICRGIN